MRSGRSWACVVWLLMLALVGCGIPRDADGTLDRARLRGELRVGVLASPPLTLVDGGEVSGPEADLIAGFARTQGLRVRWVVAGPEDLAKDLRHGNVDVVVGGITDRTPWESEVGLTRPYGHGLDGYGKRVDRVVAVPLGENRLVFELESYFDAREAS